MENKLCRELLEAVLDPNKDKSDVIDKLQTIIEEAPGEAIGYRGQWMGWEPIMDEYPSFEESLTKSVITSDLRHRRLNVRSFPSWNIIWFWTTMLAPTFAARRQSTSFGIGVTTELEKFFRAGWEARGMVEDADELSRMVGNENSHTGNANSERDTKGENGEQVCVFDSQLFFLTHDYLPPTAFSSEVDTVRVRKTHQNTR